MRTFRACLPILFLLSVPAAGQDDLETWIQGRRVACEEEERLFQSDLGTDEDLFTTEDLDRWAAAARQLGPAFDVLGEEVVRALVEEPGGAAVDRLVAARNAQAEGDARDGLEALLLLSTGGKSAEASADRDGTPDWFPAFFGILGKSSIYELLVGYAPLLRHAFDGIEIRDWIARVVGRRPEDLGIEFYGRGLVEAWRRWAARGSPEGGTLALPQPDRAGPELWAVLARFGELDDVAHPACFAGAPHWYGRVLHLIDADRLGSPEMGRALERARQADPGNARNDLGEAARRLEGGRRDEALRVLRDAAGRQVRVHEPAFLDAVPAVAPGLFPHATALGEAGTPDPYLSMMRRLVELAAPSARDDGEVARLLEDLALRILDLPGGWPTTLCAANCLRSLGDGLDAAGSTIDGRRLRLAAWEWIACAWRRTSDAVLETAVRELLLPEAEFQGRWRRTLAEDPDRDSILAAHEALDEILAAARADARADPRLAPIEAAWSEGRRADAVREAQAVLDGSLPPEEWALWYVREAVLTR